MIDCVKKIDVYEVDLSQDEPYLGSLRANETVNSQGYFVRQGNRTVYPRKNRSVVVHLQTRQGISGWGETYGLVAPRATAEIITDLFESFVIDRDPANVEAIHDDLSDLMRVRGYLGGFYSDALAAIDIALWDIVGKQQGKPLAALLGGPHRTTLPAYVSGLPRDTLPQRCELACEWQARGFDAFKFALPVADDGAVTEAAALRKSLGPKAKIACDMHWAFNAAEAITIAEHMEASLPWFLEAPLAPEDIEGLTLVAAKTRCPIAVGEEWRNIFEARLRIDQQACQIIQPEMGHTGVTQFLRIARYAEAHNLIIMPHATIGSGIFLAASLQVAAGFKNVAFHEYQHSLFGAFQSFTNGEMDCHRGQYCLPSGIGIGVEPTATMKRFMTRYT